MEYTTPKRLILIIIITLVILPVSLSFYFRAINGIDYGIGKYTQYRRDQTGLKLIAEAEKRYMEDTYGGKTPEDTMNLFIEALKKGDIELASRYFIIEKQEKYKNEFTIALSNSVIDKYISWLDNIINNGEKSTKQVDNKLCFFYYGKFMKDKKIWDEVTKNFIVFPKGSKIGRSICLIKYPAGIWKIVSL